MATNRTFWTIVSVLALYFLEYQDLPFSRFSFRCKDPKLSYPFKSDTVSGRNLFLSSTLGPIFILFLIELFKHNYSFQDVSRNILTIWKKCVFTALILLVIVQIIKSTYKEARPHFLSTCKPDSNENCEEGTWIFEYSCTNEQLSDLVKTELTRSFPSGHAAVSVFIAIYCSYFVQVSIPSGPTSTLKKIFLIMLCLSWSALCSISRITDRKHHWWDVLVGIIMGVICAIYRLYRNTAYTESVPNFE